MDIFRTLIGTFGLTGVADNNKDDPLVDLLAVSILHIFLSVGHMCNVAVILCTLLIDATCAL